MRRVGEVRRYPAGHRIAEVGAPMDRFIYIVDGEVEMIDAYTDQRAIPITLGPAQFVGDISFLSGGAYSMPIRAVRTTEVIEVTRGKMPGTPCYTKDLDAPRLKEALAVADHSAFPSTARPLTMRRKPGSTLEAQG